MYWSKTLALLAVTSSVQAVDVRLYSRDPNRDCTGTTTAICSNIAYQACCERGSTPIYRTALCSGLDTVGSGRIPDYCVGFSTRPGFPYKACQCSCNAEVASEDNSGNVCLNCDNSASLSLRGAGVWYPGGSKKRDSESLEALGDVHCEQHVEPDVMQIDGRSFAISEKHGVPADVTERFWDIFTGTPDIKFEHIPEELKAYQNENLVAPLNSTELRHAATRTLIVPDDHEERATFVKRAGLPSQCPAS